MIAAGELGEIRIVNMQFAHGFHSEAVEEANPSTQMAGRSEVRRPELRARRYRHAPALPLRGHAAGPARSSGCCAAARASSRAARRWRTMPSRLMEYDSGAVGYRLVECGERWLHARPEDPRRSAPRPASSGGTSAPTSSPTRCRAGRRKSLSVAWATFTPSRYARRPDRRRPSRGAVRGLVQSLLPLRARHGRNRSRRRRGCSRAIRYPDIARRRRGRALGRELRPLCGPGRRVGRLRLTAAVTRSRACECRTAAALWRAASARPRSMAARPWRRPASRPCAAADETAPA